MTYEYILRLYLSLLWCELEARDDVHRLQLLEEELARVWNLKLAEVLALEVREKGDAVVKWGEESAPQEAVLRPHRAPHRALFAMRVHRGGISSEAHRLCRRAVPTIEECEGTAPLATARACF